MLHHSLLYSLIRRSKIILLAGLGAGILSLFAGLLFPLEYRADAQALIIPQSRYGVDPYTVVKSAERVGENIVAIMKTDDFYQKVVAQSGPALDTSRFAGVSERVKRKRWQRAVRASVVYGTGIVNISAYHAKPDEAKALAAATAETLAAKGWEYVGGDVTIKVVNPPLVTRWPARPNLAVNALAGFVVGVVVMSLYVRRDA